MQVQLQLYASLMQFLPPGADRHRYRAEVEEGISVNAFLDHYHVPREHAHLVLQNGVFVHCDDRDATLLSEGDVIAVWPPVAGG